MCLSSSNNTCFFLYSRNNRIGRKKLQQRVLFPVCLCETKLLKAAGQIF
ncbi:unnamed protein product [Ixodes persulcatus]